MKETAERERRTRDPRTGSGDVCNGGILVCIYKGDGDMVRGFCKGERARLQDKELSRYMRTRIYSRRINAINPHLHIPDARVR